MGRGCERASVKNERKIAGGTLRVQERMAEERNAFEAAASAYLFVHHRIDCGLHVHESALCIDGAARRFGGARA